LVDRVSKNHDSKTNTPAVNVRNIFKYYTVYRLVVDQLSLQAQN